MSFRYDAFEWIEQRGWASVMQPVKIVTAPHNAYTIPEDVTSEAGNHRFRRVSLYHPAVSSMRFQAAFPKRGPTIHDRTHF
jgi:hypothetical protein